jgi:hypothetical protein
MGTIRVVASRPSTEAGMTRSIQQVAGFGKSHPQPATNSQRQVGAIATPGATAGRRRSQRPAHRILAALFFLAVAYAIVKHDLFDVDRVVRQGFIYAVLSAIVVGTYAGVLLVPAVLVPDQAARLQVPLGLSAWGEGSRGAGCPISSALSPGTTPCP